MNRPREINIWRQQTPSPTLQTPDDLTSDVASSTAIASIWMQCQCQYHCTVCMSMDVPMPTTVPLVHCIFITNCCPLFGCSPPLIKGDSAPVELGFKIFEILLGVWERMADKFGHYRPNTGQTSARQTDELKSFFGIYLLIPFMAFTHTAFKQRDKCLH